MNSLQGDRSAYYAWNNRGMLGGKKNSSICLRVLRTFYVNVLFGYFSIIFIKLDKGLRKTRRIYGEIIRLVLRISSLINSTFWILCIDRLYSSKRSRSFAGWGILYYIIRGVATCDALFLSMGKKTRKNRRNKRDQEQRRDRRERFEKREWQCRETKTKE